MTIGRLFLHPLWLFLALPGYVGWRLLSGLSLGPAGIAVGIVLLIGCCLFIPFAMRTRALQNRNLADRVLAGVTDYSAHHFDPAQRSDPAAALLGAPADAGARVLLAHQPSSATAAASAGFDVQISGHTHGGQFWPWNLFVHFFQPFSSGLHRLKNLRIYVSRGTGYWGPPNRFGVPSEITRIRLVPATP